FDIVLLQEPCIDDRKYSRSPPHWYPVYPTGHRRDGAPRSRAFTLVHKRLSTGSWEQVPVEHPDLVVLKLVTASGTLFIFNIY
ncbi:hypothetical protein K474DRAFT_1559002, partial [Panus rudis PR-1116 ss-1]